MSGLRRSIAAAVAVAALLVGVAVVRAPDHGPLGPSQDAKTSLQQPRPSAVAWVSASNDERASVVAERLRNPFTDAGVAAASICGLAVFWRRRRAGRTPRPWRRALAAVAVRGPPLVVAPA
jgi:hypothetical protein